MQFENTYISLDAFSEKQQSEFMGLLDKAGYTQSLTEAWKKYRAAKTSRKPKRSK